MRVEISRCSRPYEGRGVNRACAEEITWKPSKYGRFLLLFGLDGIAHPGQSQHERGQNMTADWGIRWGKMFPSRAGRRG